MAAVIPPYRFWIRLMLNFEELKNAISDSLKLKIFRDWTNHHLKRARIDHRLVSNLQADIHDGLVLANIITALVNQQVEGIDLSPATESGEVENIQTCLHFLRNFGVPVDNLSAKEIHDGHRESILKLFFSLARFRKHSRSPGRLPAPTMLPSPASSSVAHQPAAGSKLATFHPRSIQEPNRSDDTNGNISQQRYSMIPARPRISGNPESGMNVSCQNSSSGYCVNNNSGTALEPAGTTLQSFDNQPQSRGGRRIQPPSTTRGKPKAVKDSTQKVAEGVTSKFAEEGDKFLVEGAPICIKTSDGFEKLYGFENSGSSKTGVGLKCSNNSRLTREMKSNGVDPSALLRVKHSELEKMGRDMASQSEFSSRTTSSSSINSIASCSSGVRSSGSLIEMAEDRRMRPSTTNDPRKKSSKLMAPSVVRTKSASPSLPPVSPHMLQLSAPPTPLPTSPTVSRSVESKTKLHAGLNSGSKSGLVETDSRIAAPGSPLTSLPLQMAVTSSGKNTKVIKQFDKTKPIDGRSVQHPHPVDDGKYSDRSDHGLTERDPRKVSCNASSKESRSAEEAIGSDSPKVEQKSVERLRNLQKPGKVSSSLSSSTAYRTTTSTCDNVTQSTSQDTSSAIQTKVSYGPESSSRGTKVNSNISGEVGTSQMKSLVANSARVVSSPPPVPIRSQSLTTRTGSALKPPTISYGRSQSVQSTKTSGDTSRNAPQPSRTKKSLDDVPPVCESSSPDSRVGNCETDDEVFSVKPMDPLKSYGDSGLFMLESRYGMTGSHNLDVTPSRLNPAPLAVSSPKYTSNRAVAKRLRFARINPHPEKEFNLDVNGNGYVSDGDILQSKLQMRPSFLDDDLDDKYASDAGGGSSPYLLFSKRAVQHPREFCEGFRAAKQIAEENSLDENNLLNNCDVSDLTSEYSTTSTAKTNESLSCAGSLANSDHVLSSQNISRQPFYLGDGNRRLPSSGAGESRAVEGSRLRPGFERGAVNRATLPKVGRVRYENEGRRTVESRLTAHAIGNRGSDSSSQNRQSEHGSGAGDRLDHRTNQQGFYRIQNDKLIPLSQHQTPFDTNLIPSQASNLGIEPLTWEPQTNFGSPISTGEWNLKLRPKPTQVVKAYSKSNIRIPTPSCRQPTTSKPQADTSTSPSRFDPNSGTSSSPASRANSVKGFTGIRPTSDVVCRTRLDALNPSALKYARSPFSSASEIEGSVLLSLESVTKSSTPCLPSSLSPRTNSYRNSSSSCSSSSVNGNVGSMTMSGSSIPHQTVKRLPSTDEEVHGSRLSLTSTASSSIYSTGGEKQAQEVRKLRRELEMAQEKINNLTSQLSTNAHVVAAFEQSLTCMTSKLQKLTVTTELKETEVDELKATLHSIQTQSRNHFGTHYSNSGRGLPRPQSSLAHTTVSEEPGELQDDSLANGASKAKDDGLCLKKMDKKQKKKNWLKSSITKAFSRKKSKSGSDNEMDTSSQKSTDTSTPNSPQVSSVARVASVPNSPSASNSRLVIAKASQAGSDAGLVGNGVEVVLKLQKQLHEKDMKLTDIQLEALSSAHQLEQLRDSMNRMKGEVVSLKSENERLQKLVETTAIEPTRTERTGSERNGTERSGFDRSAAEWTQTEQAVHDSHQTNKIKRPGLPSSIDSLDGGRSRECNRYLVRVQLGPSNCPLESTETTIGRVTVTSQTNWESLDSIVDQAFKDHIERIDTGSLGLTTACVSSYRIGKIERVKGCGSVPDLLPCGYLVGENNSILIDLKGANDENAVDLLSFETLVPKNIFQRYISLLHEHRRLILCGPTGTGKTYLAQKLAEHLAQMRGRRPVKRGAIATFNVDHKSGKELRQYLSNVAEQCEQGSSDIPTVIILDDLHHAGPLEEAFGALFDIKLQLCPFIIGTMNQTGSTNLQLHHNFRWVLCANHLEPVQGFLSRYLKRRLVEAEFTSGCQDLDQLSRIVDWLPLAWRHLNKFLETYCSADVTIGPRLFLSCPMDVHSSQIWFTDLWNYSIVPYLLEATRDGLQMCSHRNVWEDPTAWVIDNYPWSSETVNKDWPSLLHLRPEDVGREGGSSNNINSCSNNNFVSTHDNKDVDEDEATFNPELPISEVNSGSRTSEDPLMTMLLRLQETANAGYSSPHSMDSDTASVDSAGGQE